MPSATSSTTTDTTEAGAHAGSGSARANVRERHQGRASGINPLEGTTVVRICGACGQKNRIPIAHATGEARCGRCKQPIPALAEPLDATPEVFDEVLREAAVPALVDFWAEWCGPCRRAAPEVKAVAAAMAGRALVLKVDTEAHPQLAARYGVQSIPNFVVIRNGQVVLQQPGLVDRSRMMQWLEQAGA